VLGADGILERTKLVKARPYLKLFLG